MNRELIAALAIFVFGLGSGWMINGWRKDAAFEHAESERQTAAAQAAIENAKMLADAQDRGDMLVARVAAAEMQRDRITEEKNREIRRLTVGRPCLDGAAVRLLNQSADGLRLAGPVPQAASESLSTDAAFATDTDVGVWIGQCKRGYDTCRGRLQGIAEFYDKHETGSVGQ